MIRKSKTPYIRDVFLAYLIDGANRTEPDGFPIIEKWMVATEPPNEVYQWDRRMDVKDPNLVGMSFYCNDPGFVPILNNPKAYVDKLRKYACVIGMDASPYDNMPLVVQKSQIYLNLAVTYFFGKQGLKIVPNVRLGSNDTMGSLAAYPKGTLIAVGTNGFTRKLDNRYLFADQIMRVVNELEPSGIVVYGPDHDELFNYVRLKGIPIYQYDSYMMKENKKDRITKNNGGKSHER